MMIFSTYASMNFVTRLSLTAVPGLLPIYHKDKIRFIKCIGVAEALQAGPHKWQKVDKE